MIVESNKITVVDDGWGHSVQLDMGQCSCKEFSCKHLKIAVDIACNNGVEFRHLLMSAFHKEIRRSDLKMAMHYGSLLSRTIGAGFVSKYARTIAFEETRNASLLDYLGKHSWKVDVAILALSTKKWELPERLGHTFLKSEAYQRAVSRGPREEDPVNLWEHERYFDAVEELFRIRLHDKTKTVRVKMFELLHEIDPSNPIGVLVAKDKVKPSFYDCILGMEMFYGMVDEDDFLYENTNPQEIEDNVIVFPSSYAFDIHTLAGKSAIYRNWKKIKPNEPLPNGLDLRWSGSVLSCLWREKAFAKFGSEYKNKKWEEVDIYNDEWRMAKIYDAGFYKKMYKKLEPEMVLQ